MVTEKLNNLDSFGLFNDIRSDAPAHELERSGERDSALLPVAPGGAVIDAGRQPVQLSVGKRGRLPDVSAAAAETGVIFGEKPQERYR